MPATGKTTHSLSIISFNTLGVPIMSKNLTERYVVLANLIKQTDADILAFQEVHTYLHLQILKKLLNEFPYVIYPKFIYGPKGGLVTFSRLPISSFNFNKFSKRGSLKNITFYARFIRNGTLVCQLKELPVYILNTYFTKNPDPDWVNKNDNALLQESQIKDVQALLSLIKESRNVAVLAGDFNFNRSSQGYTFFSSLTKAKNVFEKFHLPTYFADRKLFWFNGKSSDVDFIFVKENGIRVKVKETKHIFDEKVKLFNGKQSYLSDHIGLYAKLEFDV